ncbi:hypothetical protein PILCRDRAFT_16443 [Piloderma croceum F 1598]|uniref:Uncharacterized protein n=1 Tax=Piloderma croceum (strain F 1598) TaxID=765440 RepID=A0A0C3EWI8_PILCF|nr:hypothetical protein PILCRDRAFT_16443 [Piloderma croceum F 1598]
MYIHQCDFDVQIAEEVEHFMTNQFLYWLEVMSMLRKANRVTQGLRSVIVWSKMYDDRISAFMADAAKFVAAFATPHRAESETFQQKYTKIMSINSGKAINWPAIQNVLHGHSGLVCSVAFSPDGSRIVSGSFDITIRLWDAETGDAIGKPLEGHSSHVNSVAFSPDGSHIVSGSLDETITHFVHVVGMLAPSVMADDG